MKGDEYKTRGFKLEKRTYNKELVVSKGKTTKKMAKNDYKSEDEYISYTLDIDKILTEKFNFKTINEMSADELKNLDLSYDEEFIYFLSSCDLGNEIYLQKKSGLKNFPVPNAPFKNIKPETILKIYNYFDRTKLNKRIIENVIKEFDDPKNLFDAYDKIKKENEESLYVTKYIVANLYFGNPVKIDKVFKYIDELGSVHIKSKSKIKARDMVEIKIESSLS